MMNARHVLVALLCAAGISTLVQCGASGSTPSSPATPPTGVTPTPTPTPTPVGGLPPGLVCDPTPPPIVRMQLSVHSSDGGRIVLDSKPLVANVDSYCDRVGFGGWKFCETRPEGNAQRVACDYMVTGKSEDTSRWGPTWYYNDRLCSLQPEDCANHQTEQFLAVAKDAGRYTACAQDSWPIAAGGTSCGWIDVK